MQTHASTPVTVDTVYLLICCIKNNMFVFNLFNAAVTTQFTNGII